MKRGKKMILLIGLLGVLLVGYGLIGQMNETTPVSESEGSFPLWTQEKTISSVKWELEGTTYAFSMGENVWTKDDDEAFPVNQTVVQNIADALVELTAVRELTDISQLEDYGLAQPVFTVTAADADGAIVTFAMGDETPFGDGYYVSVSGKEAVYVVEDALSDAFDKTLTQLASMETLPDVTDVTRMTVGNALDITYDETMQAWMDTATGEILDSSSAQTLISAATGLEWSELIATNATEEQLAQWQLDDAQATKVTLYNGDTAALELLLGGQDDETDRYARLPQSAMVYTFYSSDADDLLEASVDTLWNRTPVTMTADQLGQAVFSWDGGERTLTAQDSESSAAQSIMEQLSSLEGTARVEMSEPGGVVLSVSLTDAEGKSKTLSISVYDVDSYLIPITDTYGMLVPAEDVDKLIRMLKQQA